MMSFGAVEVAGERDKPRGTQPRRATLAAAANSTLGFLPVFLVVAQGGLVREELAFDEARLGLLASIFFAMGALLGAPAGRLTERLGPRRGMMTASAAVAAVLLLVATTAHSWLSLAIWMAVAGGVNVFSQTSSDLSVARGVPADIHGFAYGVKTSSMPLATLVAGAAIPLVGVRFGWRVPFFAAATIAILIAWLLPRETSFDRPPPSRTNTRPDASRAALVLLGVSGGLVVGAVATTAAFYVEWATRLGLSTSTAGWWLAAGSLSAVAGRISFGAYGDRLERGHLTLVGWLWVGGGVGLLLMAPTGSLVMFAVGTLLAFAAGSGWTGLFLTATIRSSPNAPASASGFVMMGHFAGSVVGPLAFGAAASRGHYSTAWVATGVAVLVGAALIPWTQRLLRRDAKLMA